MRQSLRELLAPLTAFLLERHGKEWAVRSHGMATFVIKPGRGATIILRTPVLGALRLVSARVLTKVPSSDAEWLTLRLELLKRGRNVLASAKYRYLFVPPGAVERAQVAMARTRVLVLPNNSLQRTIGPAARLPLSS
jgi:hypothetical protein